MSLPSPLHASARRLLTAFLFFGIASPMIGTFTNVFLWHQGKSLPLLICYTLAFYLFLPLGFFLSYRLVGRVTHRLLFLVGTIGAGIVPLTLIFSPTFLPWVVVLFGALLGTAQGVLWSTRNYLTLNATNKESRLRFSSIESVIGTGCGLIVPFLVGWGLEMGARLGYFSLNEGYRWMGLIALCFLAISGWIVYDRTEAPPKQPSLHLLPLHKQWKILRCLECIQGIISGVATLLPVILILLFVGREGAVGTVSSMGALVTALVIFSAGRFVRHERRLPILFVSLIGDTLAALAAMLLPAPQGIIIFLALYSGTTSLRSWVTIATMYHAIEVEQKTTGSSREGLLFDRELVLDLGRAVGLISFLCLYLFIPSHAPFVAIGGITILQCFVYPLCKKLDQQAEALIK